MNKTDFFIKKIVCPVCKNNVDTLVIKSAASRMVKRDEDFCSYYEPINRLFYDVWICSECGYAAFSDKFESLTDKDIKEIKQNIRNKWVKRDFSGERNMETALAIYKIALLNLQVIGAKNIDIVKITIRIAWLYRMIGDEREKHFLELTLQCYMDIYLKEKLPLGNLDDRTCMYMIGELNRRLGYLQEASKWFYNTITFKGENKDAKLTPAVKNIISMAREQMQNIKESKES